MNTRKVLTALILLTCFVLLQANTIQDTYQKMLDTYGKLNSWQAAISQTNYFKQAQTTLTSNGSFYYQKGKIAIRYNKPNEQYVLVKDGKITIYDKAAQTAVRTALDSSVQSLNPVEIIKAYWNQSDLSMTAVKNGKVTVTLGPRNNSQIKQIRFTLDCKTNYVTMLTYTDTQGNSVSLSFTKIKANPAIAASVWTLPIPKTVKIMEY